MECKAANDQQGTISTVEQPARNTHDQASL